MQFTLILYNLLFTIFCCVKDNISSKFVRILMYHNQGCYKLFPFKAIRSGTE